MTVKAVLFDLDGVLVDSRKLHHNSWCFAVKDVCGVTLDEFPQSRVSGKSPKVIAQILSDLYGDSSKASEILFCKNAHLKNQSNTISLLPGVASLFTLFKEKGIPFGIASNASRHFVSQCIKNGNLEVLHFYGYEDYTKAKPNPEPYQKLATTLGIATKDFKDVFVFEDSQPGITAALNAGMQVIHIHSYSVVSPEVRDQVRFSFENVGEAIALFEQILE
ncbi:HAD family hydrolase [Dokdonia sp. Hel_I_53]|uniref:HAD family hydrolase n=1 Tax=Dokdonia sp. Hel_I_53 TaxID=1566287 RepID=UPI00119C0957|nr:HAD family phosphatase [Dokdonia sp. Hel_I_53]TVZ51394.1 HAD superfamily hydrolase (TIGR01509 family) [Dokdonia sp. Hel_I_53]